MRKNIFLFIITLFELNSCGNMSVKRDLASSYSDRPYIVVETKIALSNLYLEDLSIEQEEVKKAKKFAIESYQNIKKGCGENSNYPITQKYVKKITEKLFKKSFIMERYKTDYGLCIEVSKSFSQYRAGIIGIDVDLLLTSKNEAEIVFIIAHELSHYILKHRTKTRLMAYMGYSELARDLKKADITTEYNSYYEQEADILALQLLINADYDPKKSLRLVLKERAKSGGHHYTKKELRLVEKIVFKRYLDQMMSYRKDLSKNYWTKHESQLLTPKIPKSVKTEIKHSSR